MTHGVCPAALTLAPPGAKREPIIKEYNLYRYVIKDCHDGVWLCAYIVVNGPMGLCL